MAGQIVKLTRERNQYKNRNLTISEAAIRRLDPYEEELVDEIKKMYEQEAYQKALDGDLEKLHAKFVCLYFPWQLGRKASFVGG